MTKKCRSCKLSDRAPNDVFCAPCREAVRDWLDSLAIWFSKRLARP